MFLYDLSSDVVAFSTTRSGGVSSGNYTSFNINHYCGDDPDAIAENQLLLCRRLGIGCSMLVYPHQTHQTVVRQIDDSFMALDDDERDAALEGVDALVTDVRGVCIGVSTADCIPIIIYDPEHHAVATVHAGWRGTVGRIVEKAVAAMVRIYASQPSQLRAVIGPGISLDSFEVGDEVYDAFENAGFPMDEIARRYPRMNNCDLSDSSMSWHIDLPKCNAMQLLDCGMAEEKIQMSGICTFKCYDEFFSARRLGINSGRIFTGAMLR